jgi:hypothetical protein
METSFTVSNITWDYFNPQKQILNIVPDIKSMPSVVTILHEDLDMHELPDVGSYTYEAERDWMIQGYLLDNFKMFAETFEVSIT